MWQNACMKHLIKMLADFKFVTEILLSTDQCGPHAESTLIRLHELMPVPTVSTINIPTVDCTHIYSSWAKIYYIAQTPIGNTSQTFQARYRIDYSDYAPFTALCPQHLANQNCWIRAWRDNDKTKTIHSHYFLRCKLMYSTAYYFCSQSSCAKFATRRWTFWRTARGESQARTCIQHVITTFTPEILFIVGWESLGNNADHAGPSRL